MVFLFAVLLILSIIAFFFFLGCPYEFVKCYLHRNDHNDDDDEENYYDRNRRNKEKDENEDIDKPLNWKDYLIIFFLIVLGIFLQPIYLLFYVLMAFMEMYRQCGCWALLAFNS
jgi:hypothetical protein